VAPDPFDITYGYSKDKRPDLKQFIVSMLCVDRNIPILGSPRDGNASDKTINNEVLTGISKHMARFGLEPGAFVYVADSAFVTPDNLAEADGNNVRFLSRLPATYKECDRVIEQAVTADNWIDIGSVNETVDTQKKPAAQYKAYDTTVSLYDKEYRAVVFHSSAHDKRRHKRIDRLLAKKKKQLADACKKVVSTPFFCEPDARTAAEKLMAGAAGSYHRIQCQIQKVDKYKRGRPKKGEPRKPIGCDYHLTADIIVDDQAVEPLRTKAGCFVLITNLSSAKFTAQWPAEELLRLYKSQSGIEQNFGFLKDPIIVNSIFLKRPRRIEALGLVLLIALLIWRLMERCLRQYIRETDATITGWKNKPTKRPTAFMMTTKFIHILVLKSGNRRQLAKPLNPIQLEYLAALNVSPNVYIEP
jgi:transposase